LVTPPGAAAQNRPQLKRPQQDVPQEKPPEDKKAKKVKGPRAVAILQLTSKGKATLVPIAIQVDGKFYDASVYKADPVPMALESGTVYEVEQSGESLGLFTVGGALHSKAVNTAHPWVGSGLYLLNGTEAAKSTRKAEDVPVGLDSSGSDAPPRLSRKDASKPATASNSAPASSSPAKDPAPTVPAGPASSEKPAAPAPSSSSPPASGSSSTGSGDKDAADSAKKPTTTGTSPASDKDADQGGGNYYRPTLRRGKPVQSAPPEEESSPQPAAASKTGSPNVPGAPGTPVATTPDSVQLVPAISDGGGPEPKPYKFYWKSGEEDERRGQMLAGAADEVRAYANALLKNRILATPPAKKPVPVHKTPAKPVPPVFENVQFRAFDVWLNNQPVMILTAEAHFPPAPGTTTAPEVYSITLVTRTDIYGNLRKVFSAVTDKFHLDVTPRLELIDAVDADGDNRGELLFHETNDAGSGYVIYRATADKLVKMFDSLNAE
jgi:hypothetical protein